MVAVWARELVPAGVRRSLNRRHLVQYEPFNRVFGLLRVPLAAMSSTRDGLKHGGDLIHCDSISWVSPGTKIDEIPPFWRGDDVRVGAAGQHECDELAEVVNVG